MKIARTLLVAALATTTLIACQSTPSESRQSVGSYVDDATLTTRVKAAMAQDKQVRVSQVNVETYKGVVQLSGFVDSEADVRQAGELARKVDGVKSVKNDLRVKPR